MKTPRNDDAGCISLPSSRRLSVSLFLKMNPSEAVTATSMYGIICCRAVFDTWRRKCFGGIHVRVVLVYRVTQQVSSKCPVDFKTKVPFWPGLA